MYQRSSGGRFLEIFLFALSSLVLYFTGVGALFFLIPLQVIGSRRGMRSLLPAAGLFVAGFAGLQLVPPLLSGGTAAPDILVLVEIATIVTLLLGLVICNMPLRRRPRTLLLLLAAMGVSGAVAVPAGLWLAGNTQFQQSMTRVFTDFSKTVLGLVTQSDGVLGSLLATALEPAKLQQVVGDVLLRSFLLGYLAIVSFSWWAGQAAAARSAALFGTPPGFRFAQFRLESWWLWPLIAAGALIAADLFFGISFWAYAAWNVGFVLLFLFMLQGMAILRFLFEKHGIPRLLWLLLVLGIGFLAVRPGAGPLAIVAVALFGISENWIRYRIPPDAAPKQEN